MSDERNYQGDRVPQGDYGAPEYEQPVYSAPVYEQTIQEPVKAKTGLATAALVFGILALITTLFLINYVFGILSILFGVIYLAMKADIKPKGKAITGLVLSIISLAISTTIWVGAYMYIVNTEITTIVEDVAALMGEEVDGREMLNEMIMESTGNAVDLSTVEDFVGGEVSIQRAMNFVDGVSEEELYIFIDKMENVDVEALAAEFEGEVTYEALEEKLGSDFTLRDIMEFIDENAVYIEEADTSSGAVEEQIVD